MHQSFQTPRQEREAIFVKNYTYVIYARLI